jgi:UDP-glucose:(heptosyl)LPS alpha-1,3-glucosyltransferase
MRIALNRRRFSATGGAENYLERLAKELQQRGHQTTLVCEQWKQSGSALEDIRTVDSSDPAGFSRTVQALELKREFDLVFSLERVPGCDLYRAGDGVHAEWLEQRARYSPLLGRWRTALNPKNRVIRQLEEELYRPESTGRIIANSKMIKRSIVARFGYPADRIDVIYNGVPFKQFSSGDRAVGRKALSLAHDAYVVLLVGSGEERKGVRYARTAVNRVPGAQLVVIDQPVAIPLPDVYAAADVFLLPTLYDPFANVTLEAMAAGLPVITTVHNGAAEIITHNQNGFILEWADDIAGIARELENLRDKKVCEKFHKLSQDIAIKFDMNNNLNQTLEAFKKIDRQVLAA